jgi:hypothetical protein
MNRSEYSTYTLHLRTNSARRAPRSSTPTDEAISTSNQVSSIAGPEYKAFTCFSIKVKAVTKDNTVFQHPVALFLFKLKYLRQSSMQLNFVSIIKTKCLQVKS